MSKLSRELDRHLKMHIVRRDLKAIQERKHTFNQWMQYVRQELLKMMIK